MADVSQSAQAQLSGLRETVDGHFEEFERLVSLARKTFLAGAYESSAAYVQVAAYYAWFHPTGLFASPELEEILTAIGKSLTAGVPPVSENPQTPPKKILHVLTEVHNLGGHTRLTWRWIRADANRSHSVVLTSQGAPNVPELLKTATEESGGKLTYLDRVSGGLLERARDLQRMATDADQVVLHIHPYDVIPILAFADRRRRPPVAFLNHNDHVFWIGGSTADQVAQIRNSGLRLTHNRRGIPKTRSSLLPIPLEENSLVMSRAAARKQLDLPQDAVILLTVAAAYKYNAPAGQHFTDAILPVIQKYPNVTLLVLGPDDRDEWASASKQADGRMKVLGRRADAAVFYQAANIYLDSFPIASLTSFLEAGSYGVPIVSYCARSREAEVACGDDPALSDLMKRPCNVPDFRIEVSRLVEDEQTREKLGELTKQAILSYHMKGGWNRFVEELYARSHAVSMNDTLETCEAYREFTELDGHLAQIFRISGLTNDVEYIFRNTVGMFPFWDRMGIWREVFGYGWRELPSCLLSDDKKIKLKIIWSRLTKGRKAVHSSDAARTSQKKDVVRPINERLAKHSES